MTIKLSAQARAAQENLDKDFLPAVMYGRKIDNQNLKIKAAEFVKVLAAAGESSLVDLTVDSQEPVKVMIKDVQFSNIKRQPRHVDFYQVDMTQKVTAEVELEFVGSSPAEHSLGGIVLKQLTHLEIECLPKDLVHTIKVDLSKLENLNDEIKIADLTIPDGITVKRELTDIVVAVSEPKAVVEEVIKPAEAEAAAVAEGEKKEGEVKEEEKVESKK